MRRAEYQRRRKLRCPNCGRPGTLVVGSGLYPFVEHRAESEINTGIHTECWVPRDLPEVRELLAIPPYAGATA